MRRPPQSAPRRHGEQRQTRLVYGTSGLRVHNLAFDGAQVFGPVLGSGSGRRLVRNGNSVGLTRQCQRRQQERDQQAHRPSSHHCGPESFDLGASDVPNYNPAQGFDSAKWDRKGGSLPSPPPLAGSYVSSFSVSLFLARDLPTAPISKARPTSEWKSCHAGG